MKNEYEFTDEDFKIVEEDEPKKERKVCPKGRIDVIVIAPKDEMKHVRPKSKIPDDFRHKHRAKVDSYIKAIEGILDGGKDSQDEEGDE